MTDAQLKHLAYDSPASQDGWEVWQMLRHLVDLNPQVIVEIGCDGGGFLETLEQLFPKALITGIEIRYRQELDRYNMIFGNSMDQATLAKLPVRPIDFLFIDGDHHYESVKKEYQMYSPLVRTGGIIGFHDTNNRGITGVEVDQFMKELDEQQSYLTADFRADGKSPGTRLIWV